MHNTASKYFCSVLYFRGCCLVLVTCLVLYLWRSGLRLREAEPLGKTWTGLISRHWGEEKGMTLCEERCCRSMEVIKSWTKTNINGQTWKSTCMIFPAKPGPGFGKRRGMTEAWRRCCKVMVDTTTPMPRSSQLTKNNTWGRHWGEKGDDCILAGFPNTSLKVFLP